MRISEANFRNGASRMALVTRNGSEKRNGGEPAPASTRHWTFLSNHGHVLVCLAQNPDARLRDVAQAVGITERAVQKIVSDLEEAGVVMREREGRRNRYSLHTERPLRHPIEAHRTVGALLAMVLDRAEMRRISSQGGEPR
jgi:DNA-binding transcriptional ArsR family regulator